MATNEIDVICGQLINAVRAMMDPMTPSQVRLNAFKHCEQFKEESPADLGIQCAITLSSSSGNLQHTQNVLHIKTKEMYLTQLT